MRDGYHSPAWIDAALKFRFIRVGLVLESGISESSLERSHFSLDPGNGEDGVWCCKCLKLNLHLHPLQLGLKSSCQLQYQDRGIFRLYPCTTRPQEY